MLKVYKLIIGSPWLIKLAFITVLLSLFFCFSANAHPLKMCLTEVNVNGNNIKVRMKLFSDDFEVCLSSFCKKNIELSTTSIDESLRIAISNYILQNFSISHDKKIVKLLISSIKLEDGLADNSVVWIELNSPVIKFRKESTMGINNILLFDHIPEQRNIVYIIKTGNKEKKILTFENIFPYKTQYFNL